MSSRIYINAKHSLELSCPGCPDKSRIDIESGYGPTLVEAVAAYELRHDPCLKRLDAEAAEREAKKAEQDAINYHTRGVAR